MFSMNVFANAIQYFIDGCHTFPALLRFDKERFLSYANSLQTKRGRTDEKLGELLC